MNGPIDAVEWLPEDGDEGEHLYLTCRHCGKNEAVLQQAFENGDAWPALDLCGGTSGCTL